MAVEEKRARGGRVRALRERLGLTQEQVAERARFPRAHMSKFESGDNAATTTAAIASLARGFGVEAAPFAEYLNGRIDLDRILYAVSSLKTPRAERPGSTVREFLTWYYASKAVVQAVDLHEDITVEDLLRLRAEPPRAGEADAEQVYRHIEQLRAGRIGEMVPATYPSTADMIQLADQAHDQAMTKPPRRREPS